MRHLWLIFLLAGCRTELNDSALIGNVKVAGETQLDGLVVTLSGPSLATTTTAADGSYRFAPLLGGPYQVSAHAPSTKEDQVSVAVDVGGVTVAPDLQLTPVGELHGRATRGGAKLGNAGISVSAGESSAVTDDTGAYHLIKVPVGVYDVRAQADGYGSAVAPMQPVRWGQLTEVPEIDLVIAKGPANLHGRALLFAATQHAGTQVSAVGTGRTATTMADGTWEIDGIPEGTYALQFDHGDFHETIPQVIATAGDNALVVDGNLYPLEQSPLTLYRARRIVSQASLGDSGTAVLSHDQQHLAYLDAASLTLAVVNFDGSGAHSLGIKYGTPGLPVTQLAFSPDDARLFAVVGQRLSVAPIGNGMASDWDTGINDFWFSPNGQHVALQFYYRGSTEPWIEVTDMTGGPRVPITGGNGLSLQKWSADSSHLLCHESPGTNNGLDRVDELIPATGGTPQVLPGVEESYVRDFSADGVYALITTYQADVMGGLETLYNLNMNTGAIVPLVSGNRGVSYWGRYVAGNHVAYENLVVGTNSAELWLVPASGGTAADLGPIDETTPEVSTDLSTMVWERDCDSSKTHCDLWLASLADGHTWKLTSGVASWHSLTADGKKVAYQLSNAAGDSKTWWIEDSAGGTPVAIANPDAGLWGWSADDSRLLYFTQIDMQKRGTLRSFDTTTGAVTTIASLVNEQAPSFAPDGRHVAVVVMTSDAKGQPVTTLTTARIDGAEVTAVFDGLVLPPYWYLWRPAWRTSGALIVERNGTPPPYRFQNGIYAFTP